MRSTRSILIAALAVTAPLAGTAVLAFTADAAPTDLKSAKAATAKYRSLKIAKRDGYVPEGPCVASPDGGMGFHYVNPQLAGDGKIDPRRPEMLLYRAGKNGKLKLAGVEYFVAATDQTPPIDDTDAPTLFGQRFDGPMEGHGPGMPFHYDLHVWFWSENANGMFAPFNPAVTCPK